ncbi:MAG: beta-ketoacyl-ACP synthase II [Caulobacteraceae bacterium]
MRRVVVTGLGLVTPLGWGVESSWRAILAGRSGGGRITSFDTTDYACQVACETPWSNGRGGGSAEPTADVERSFDPDQVLSPKERRRMDDFILYAIAAADEAVTDSGWRPEDEPSRCRTGVIFGSGIGGLQAIAATALELAEKGPRRISPFFIPSALVNLASGQISIRHSFKGPNHAVVTACATGAHAVGDAFRIIKYGDADVMVAGGAEAAICPLGMAGFIACRAVSTGFNDRPTKASRPYDKDRDGFVMGDGAGALVLEEYEHAKARGAKIYGEVIGYGMSGDAYHITSPTPDGDGGYRAMEAALNDARIGPADISYINAHGTSTPVGDEIELGAVERIMGKAAQGKAMSSTKSATGHLLGAAGAVEAAFSLLALRDQIAPPTINLDNPSVDTPLDLVPHHARPMAIERVLSNSFGFGGTNAALVFARAG